MRLRRSEEKASRLLSLIHLLFHAFPVLASLGGLGNL